MTKDEISQVYEIARQVSKEEIEKALKLLEPPASPVNQPDISTAEAKKEEIDE